MTINTIVETHFATQREAMQEASRIRLATKDADVLVKVDESPYGGYRIKVIPIDIIVDVVEHSPYFSNRRF